MVLTKKLAGKLARRSLKRSVGTAAESVSLSTPMGREMVLEGAAAERRAAHLLKLRAEGIDIPEGTRYLGRDKRFRGAGLSRTDMEDHLGALPGTEAGLSRVYRGSGIEAPEFSQAVPEGTVVSDVAEIHARGQGNWATADPNYAGGYASSGTEGKMIRSRLAARSNPEHAVHKIKTLEDTREIVDKYEGWGRLQYADIPTDEAADMTAGVGKMSHALDSTSGPASELILPTSVGRSDVFSAAVQQGTDDAVKARVLRNVARSKEIRASRMEAATRARRPSPRTRDKSLARNSMSRSVGQSSGGQGGTPTRSKMF